MQIEDCVIQTLDHQISLAVTKSDFNEWERLLIEFKKLPNKPSLRKALRNKLSELLKEADSVVKNHKSKVLDLSVLSK